MIQDAYLRRLFLIPADCAAPRGAANMILNVAESTGNAMLDAVAVRLEGANLEL